MNYKYRSSCDIMVTKKITKSIKKQSKNDNVSKKSTNKLKKTNKDKKQSKNDNVSKKSTNKLKKTNKDKKQSPSTYDNYDTDQIKNQICNIIENNASGTILQNDLWKKIKITSRLGSRLTLKLEKNGVLTREKIMNNGRWTYKLIIKKKKVDTKSIEHSPCLICPVEQKCSIEGVISPKSCKLIEDWVLTEIKNKK